jgi:hypothetical protein
MTANAKKVNRQPFVSEQQQTVQRKWGNAKLQRSNYRGHFCRKASFLLFVRAACCFYAEILNRRRAAQRESDLMHAMKGKVGM